MVDCSELSKLLTEVAMDIGSRDNIKNLDDVIREMGTHFPDIRRESIVEAIVEATSREAKATNELKKKLQEIKGQAKAEKNLQDKIAELENYIETGTVPQKAVREGKETTYAVEQLRDIRNELKKKLAKSEPAQQERINKQIKALEEKIHTGDILPKTRPKVIPESKELERAIYERDKLRNEIRHQIYRLKPRTFWGTFADTWDIVRLTLTTGEFSLVGRQGGWYTLGHPISGAKKIGQMFKAFADEQYAAQVNNEILNRDLAPVGARSKLAIIPTDGTAKLSAHEEALMSHWAERIPVIKQFTRAGITYMNLIRAENFDTLYRTLGNTDTVTQDKADLIANYVNVASGRGNLGKIEPIATLLNRVFFAPKYVVSRFQLLTGQPLWYKARSVEGSAQVRKLIALEYARAFASISTVMALGLMAGGEIEKDMRSTDFGKIRFGNSRLDPLMGLSQSTVLLNRVIRGTTKTEKGDIRPLRGPDVPFNGDTTTRVINRFERYKLSPMISVPWSFLAKEDPIGRPVDAKWAATHLMTPITWLDIYEVMVDQGMAKGTAASILAMFGMGLQTYQDRGTKPKITLQPLEY